MCIFLFKSLAHQLRRKASKTIRQLIIIYVDSLIRCRWLTAPGTKAVVASSLSKKKIKISTPFYKFDVGFIEIKKNKISFELKLRIGTLEFFTSGPSYSYSRLYGNWLGSLDLLALWVCQVQIPCRGWTREQKRGLEVRNERMKRLSFRRGEQLGTTYTHINTHTSQRETHDVNTSTIFNLNYGSQALNMYHSRRCRSACEHAQHAHVATQGARLFGALCPDPGVFLLMSVRAWLEHWCCRFFARVWTSEIRDLSIS